MNTQEVPENLREIVTLVGCVDSPDPVSAMARGILARIDLLMKDLVPTPLLETVKRYPCVGRPCSSWGRSALIPR